MPGTSELESQVTYDSYGNVTTTGTLQDSSLFGAQYPDSESGLFARCLVAVACLLFTGCSSTPSVPSGPTRVPRPSLTSLPAPSSLAGVPLLDITYSSRQETAKERGPCAVGYVPINVNSAGTQVLLAGGKPICVYDSYSPDPIIANIGTAYPFYLGSLHCGVGPQQFDDVVFVPSPPPSGTSNAKGSGMLIGIGTMALTDPYHARYVDHNGAVITFTAVASVRMPGCD